MQETGWRLCGEFVLGARVTGLHVGLDVIHNAGPQKVMVEAALGLGGAKVVLVIMVHCKEGFTHCLI